MSEDEGRTFIRLYDGSILDRNMEEPCYTGAVDVIKHDGIFKMWYTSGSEWKIINNKPEIYYHIKYAESNDGIDWVRNNVFCIKPDHEFEATARPSVIYRDGKFCMWYSRRNLTRFRNDPTNGYRGGYAESLDGINWERKDDEFGLSISESGWDSEAIAYPYVIGFNKKLIMFYNGNGFGKTGIGYAVLEEKLNGE